MHIYSKKEGKYYEVNKRNLGKVISDLSNEELTRALLDQVGEHAKLKKSRKRNKPELQDTIQILAVSLYDRGVEAEFIAAKVKKILQGSKRKSKAA